MGCPVERHLLEVFHPTQYIRQLVQNVHARKWEQ
jgi:hypothetical protein